MFFLFALEKLLRHFSRNNYNKNKNNQQLRALTSIS